MMQIFCDINVLALINNGAGGAGLHHQKEETDVVGTCGLNEQG